MNKSALSNIRSKIISLPTILIGIGIGSIIFLNYKDPDTTGSVLGVDTKEFAIPMIRNVYPLIFILRRPVG